MSSTTYINSQTMGSYLFDYNGFQYDITDHVKFDVENVIAVKVDNTQPSSRWYSGSGIYRNSFLTYKNAIHVARHGTFIITPVLKNTLTKDEENIYTQEKIENNSRGISEVKVKSTILNEQDKAIVTVESDIKAVVPGVDVLFEDLTSINDPTLWDIDEPLKPANFVFIRSLL